MSTLTNSQFNEKEKYNSVFQVRSIAIIGVLSAISVILMLFEVPLWFAPSFYKIDLSEVPILIGAFALGPVAAILMEAIKILLNFAINGSITAGIGELANFIIGCALVVPSVMIYQRRKSIKTAIIGLITGTIFMAALGGLLNAFVLLPVYAKVFKMPIDALVQMGTAVNGNINSMTTFVLYAVTPFNLIKGIVVSLITIMLYKRVSPIIKTIAFK